MFLALNWPFIRQPDSHIDWVTPMSFTLIYPINPRTNIWSFGEEILRIVGFEKIMSFEFTKLQIPKIQNLNFLSLIPNKIIHKLWSSMNGTQFSWFPAKKIGGIKHYETHCICLSWVETRESSSTLEKLPRKWMVTKRAKDLKGQLISKCLFRVFNFF